MPVSLPFLSTSPSGASLGQRLAAGARLLRPHHWVKNFTCLLPPFCAGVVPHGPGIVALLLTFGAFCMASSFVYALNDLHDIEEDRAHPVKRRRPLAAGLLNRGEAVCLLLLTLGLCVAGATAVSGAVAKVILAYALLNVAYSFRLKHVAILDVMIISSGFLLRLGAGGQASGVEVSAWLILCAFFLSLFLAFSKRRAELNTPEPGKSREVLGQYTKLMLDRFSNICATLAVATYAVFTVVARPDHALLLTCPPVVFGIFRYLMLIETQGVGETPEQVLFKDVPMMMAMLVWIVCYTGALYFKFTLGLL